MSHNLLKLLSHSLLKLLTQPPQTALTQPSQAALTMPSQAAVTQHYMGKEYENFPFDSSLQNAETDDDDLRIVE
jgi:hypothetical protein